MIAATFPLTVMVKSISILYSIPGQINTWVDQHIQDMESSENETISRTGKVLQGAKFGFGIGYIAPFAIIATGQLLLGNTFTAVGTLGSAVTLSNPIAMTCAAVGAIYYGWTALSEKEQAEALEKLSNGLEVGLEFIKSVIRYVRESIGDLIKSKAMNDLKSFVGEAANRFGATLYDVTRDVTDKLAQFWSSATASISESVDKSKVALKQSSESVIQGVSGIRDGAYKALEDITRKSDK